MNDVNRFRHEQGKLSFSSFPFFVWINHKLFFKTIQCEDGFYLYLRNFSLEQSHPWQVTRRSMHWSEGISEAELYSRSIEKKILKN